MSDIKNNLKVAVEALQYHLDESEYSDSVFEDTDPCCEIIGQSRALSAVELGLEIQPFAEAQVRPVIAQREGLRLIPP